MKPKLEQIRKVMRPCRAVEDELAQPRLQMTPVRSLLFFRLEDFENVLYLHAWWRALTTLIIL